METETEKPILLEGALAITAALEAGSRDVHVVYLDQADKGRQTRRLKQAAREREIQVKRKPREQLDHMAQGKTHGGVVAEVGERRVLGLDELDLSGTPWFALLDGVEDPYNYGYAMRTLYAAGCTGLIARPRNWAQSGSGAGTVARASAGASERMALAVCEGAVEAADWAHGHGLKVVAAAQTDNSISVYQADMTMPMLVMIGGEKRGLPKAIVSEADLRITVDYGREFNAALPSVAATAAIGFEVLRQRNAKA